MKGTRFCLLSFVLALATAVAQQHPINISSPANFHWSSGTIQLHNLAVWHEKP
jgi:hypothetical protein